MENILFIVHLWMYTAFLKVMANKWKSLFLWFIDMVYEFPKDIVEDGAEVHVDKINKRCRITILRILKKVLKEEYEEVLKDPLFGLILVISEHKLGY